VVFDEGVELRVKLGEGGDCDGGFVVPFADLFVVGAGVGVNGVVMEVDAADWVVVFLGEEG